MFPFFQSSGNIPHFKQFVNIMKRRSFIASPDIFNMLVRVPILMPILMPVLYVIFDGQNSEASFQRT